MPSLKTVKYHTFLVKEGKVSSTMESQDEKQITNAVKDLIKKHSRIKVENLPSFDLEYLFLKIKASIGEQIVLTVTCRDDETQVEAVIDIDKVEV